MELRSLANKGLPPLQTYVSCLCLMRAETCPRHRLLTVSIQGAADLAGLADRAKNKTEGVSSKSWKVANEVIHYLIDPAEVVRAQNAGLSAGLMCGIL